MKTAVVYYSHSGNVKDAAEKIAAALSARLFTLEPKKPLKGTGFLSIFQGGGQATLGQKPALKSIPDLADFDRVILGTPVWAGKCAAPVNTLLASGALKGKELSVFTASGGGDDRKALSQIAAAAQVPLHTVSLIDARVPASSDNGPKIDAFIEKLKD